jgi:glyoxylase-like metal-dependent hydrolase (beta-lactamase superfamily II)
MEFQLTQLAEHIWLFPHHPDHSVVQSAVGLIATKNESLLVDAGNSPRLARQIKSELERCHLPPVSRIIYTHHHWDHIYGACEFGVPVTAHVLCRAILEEEARKPWGMELLNEEVRRNPKLAVSHNARASAVEDWDSFRIILPEQVFEKTERIDLDGLSIELEHVGGAHAEDSIMVKVRQEGVIFLGDCFYPPPLHLREPNSGPSLEMLRRLQSPAYDLYIEGHDQPFTRAELLRFLQDMS